MPTYIYKCETKIQMFKNILRLFLIVFFVATLNRANGDADPELGGNKNKESVSDSLAVDSKDNVVTITEIKTNPIVTTNKESTESFFDSNTEEVEVEEDSTSALSFNFIYYIIEKFKFQVE